MNYVYILECSDSTLYTGWTSNLSNRIKTHNLGRGAKYTRGRLPVKLVYVETFLDKREAQSREWKIKRLNRGEKLKLIKNFKREDLKVFNYEKEINL
ncbi:GIY-YIG nuclease family protein [Clostridium tarantellae]|uniref:GIY-YIG nuclease family protein n=1 Tax=Clostridium tarantellae TaxID=39493 RepID=A0A6I1MP29_9CLOT|nr:GIY-YIG nuclease family protein [Clostridium tarantellae]MPQ45266.1 GIY-YIG nuclease family protein [Clostridium tarantellae]